jgi:ArsR family metal-binding transcriptional regulator
MDRHHPQEYLVIPQMPAEAREDRQGDRETIEVNPCTEDGKVTLQSTLRTKDGVERKEPYFDAVKLCEALRKIRDFSRVRCSSEIGYAIIEYEDKRIHVFKEGKIIIRRAKDRDDATRTLNMVSAMLSDAVIGKS